MIETLRSGWYVLGPQVKSFEENAAAYLKAKHAIGCANGSDALYLALLALDIKAGDEVITTPFTYVATAEAISQIGAKPVFADIDADTYNISATEIEKNITDKTKAIIVVHLYGQVCEMDAIMALAQKHNIKVIEDSAQAFGALTSYRGEIKAAGTIGDIGTFSFYPTKNLSCAGDGGMLTTNSDELNERLRRIRVHGSSKRYYHDELGVNSRLDEVQAAILNIKLKHITRWNLQRAINASKINTALASIEGIKCPSSLTADKTKALESLDLLDLNSFAELASDDITEHRKLMDRLFAAGSSTLAEVSDARHAQEGRGELGESNDQGLREAAQTEQHLSSVVAGSKHNAADESQMMYSWTGHIYHQYTVALEADRDTIKTKLAEAEIASEVYYPLGLHQQKLYLELGYSAKDLAETTKATANILCLPVHPELSDEEISFMTQEIKSFASLAVSR